MNINYLTCSETLVNYIDLFGLTPSNSLAICPTCPNTPEFDFQRNSPYLYIYDPKTKVATVQLPEVKVTGNKTTNSHDYNPWIFGFGQSLNYLGNNNLPTGVKTGGSTPGTSIASQFFRQTLGDRKTPKWLFNTLPKRIGPKGYSMPIRSPLLGGVAGRTIPILGKGMVGVSAGVSIYNIATAENKTEALVVEGGGWGGAWAAATGTGAALTATGIDFSGPWGWAAHAVLTIGSGIGGFYAGKEVGQTIYDKTKE